MQVYLCDGCKTVVLVVSKRNLSLVTPETYTEVLARRVCSQNCCSA